MEMARLVVGERGDMVMLTRFFGSASWRTRRAAISSALSARPPSSSTSTATTHSPAVNIRRRASADHAMSDTTLCVAPFTTSRGCDRSFRHTETEPSYASSFPAKCTSQPIPTNCSSSPLSVWRRRGAYRQVPTIPA